VLDMGGRPLHHIHLDPASDEDIGPLTVHIAELEGAGALQVWLAPFDDESLCAVVDASLLRRVVVMLRGTLDLSAKRLKILVARHLHPS